MADDDDKPKKHTFASLFHVYANYQHLSVDPEGGDHDKILLSQIDLWLDQAKLLKTTFSMTETGLTYMKFKKWRLTYEEFLEFLAIICKGKKISVEELQDQLLAAGVPGGAEITIK